MIPIVDPSVSPHPSAETRTPSNPPTPPNPALAQLTRRELVELHKQRVEELLAHRGKTDNTGLTQRIEEVEDEVGRRWCQGDPEMDAIAAENLRIEELRFISPPPAEAANLTPEHAAALKDHELTALHEKCERLLAFDAHTYPDLGCVKDPFDQVMLKDRRERFETAIHILAREMMRRGLTAKLGPSRGQPDELSQAPATKAAAAKEEPARDAPSAKAAEDSFSPSLDYRTVTLGGKTYPLTPGQARIVQVLHEALKSGKPDVSIYSIMEQTPDSRWQDTFKRNPDAKKALIRSGATKGTLRLNL